MEIDLAGAGVSLEGDKNPIAEAALAALLANGGRPQRTGTPDILLLSHQLLPKTVDTGRTLLLARQSAQAMAARGSGRIVFLLSAIAAMPMRRHPAFSVEMAGILAGVRTLAMEFGPKVLVNAVGFGMVDNGGALVCGDLVQMSHTPLGRAAALEEAVAPVLFFCDPLNSYTTGQMLAVDGGWSAGYGRNF
jgi:NAD(P)-dependent dehydrogenase (short-subunit alcohol dehydrogenase family)